MRRQNGRRRARDVLELVGDDVDRAGEPGQCLLVLVGRDGAFRGRRRRRGCRPRARRRGCEARAGPPPWRSCGRAGRRRECRGCCRGRSCGSGFLCGTFGDAVALALAPGIETLRQRLVVEGQHGGGEQGRVDRARRVRWRAFRPGCPPASARWTEGCPDRTGTSIPPARRRPGSGVMAAVMPGRWAAPPAPAITTLKARRLGALGEGDQPVRGAVGRDDPGVVGDPERIQSLGGSAAWSPSRTDCP